MHVHLILTPTGLSAWSKVASRSLSSLMRHRQHRMGSFHNFLGGGGFGGSGCWLSSSHNVNMHVFTCFCVGECMLTGYVKVIKQNRWNTKKCLSSYRAIKVLCAFGRLQWSDPLWCLTMEANETFLKWYGLTDLFLTFDCLSWHFSADVTM